MNKVKQAIKLHRKIEYYEQKIELFKKYIKKTKEWKKEYQKEFNKVYKTLDTIEVMQFGQRTGYIEKNN